MCWAALSRRPPILRGVSALQIRADHAVNQAWIIHTTARRSKLAPVAQWSGNELIQFVLGESSLFLVRSPYAVHEIWSDRLNGLSHDPRNGNIRKANG